jgi:hypothetical protein
MSRGVTLLCRLLCRECAELRSIATISDDRESVRLACDHERTAFTLPARPGSVSLESADTPLGHKWWPAMLDSYGTTALDRERWTA